MGNPKTPTRLLRVQMGDAAVQPTAAKLEFTPLCTDSLKQCFDRCDLDLDQRLSYDELCWFFELTTGEELSEEQFRGLVDAVEAASGCKDAVTFEGLVQIYKMNYDELGLGKGDSLLWKDLLKFGFNPDLTHSGKWPGLPKSAPKLDAERAVALVNKFINADKKKWFCAPVDVVALNIPDYHTIIKSPMDLGTVLKKIEASKYATLVEVMEDIRLVFKNATDYNPAGNPVAKAALKFLEILNVQKDLNDAKTENQPTTSVCLDSSQGNDSSAKQKNNKPKKIASVFLKPKRRKRKKKPEDAITEPKRAKVEAENIIDVSNISEPEGDGASSERKKPPKPTKVNPFFLRKKKKTAVPSSSSASACATRPSVHWRIVEFPTFGQPEISKEEVEVPLRQAKRVDTLTHLPFPRFLPPAHHSEEAATEQFVKYTVNREIWTQTDREGYLCCEQFPSLCESLFPCSNALDEHRLKKALRCRDRTTCELWSEVYGAVLKGRHGRDGRALKEWLTSWDEILEQEFSASDSECLEGLTRAFALVGPSGLGKTKLVYNMAHKLKYKVIEVGTSVRRSSADLLAMIGECAQSNTMNNNRRGKDKALILVDDLDVVFDEDKAFFSAVKSLISRTKVPIVLTCSAIPKEFDSPESGICVTMADVPTLEQVADDVAYVCLAEGVGLNRQVINRLIRMYNMDSRRLLNELHFYCFKKGKDDGRELAASTARIHCPSAWHSPVWDIEAAKTERAIETMADTLSYVSALDTIGILDRVAVEDDRASTDCCVEVAAVVPTKGVVTGGTVIHITGSGFLSSAYVRVEVLIGRLKAQDVCVVSDSQICARTPAYPNWEELQNSTDQNVENLEDEIEEFSDADDFELPKRPPTHRKVLPSDIVVRCMLGDGTVVASDDMLEDRFNSIFTYKLSEQEGEKAGHEDLQNCFIAKQPRHSIGCPGELVSMANKLEVLSSFDTVKNFIPSSPFRPSSHTAEIPFLKHDLNTRALRQEHRRQAEQVLENTTLRRVYGISKLANEGFYTQLVPVLSKIDCLERRRKELSASRRFMHYFDRINLYDVDFTMDMSFGLS